MVCKNMRQNVLNSFLVNKLVRKESNLDIVVSYCDRKIKVDRLRCKIWGQGNTYKFKEEQK